MPRLRSAWRSTSFYWLNYAKAPGFCVQNNILLAERLVAQHAAHARKAHQRALAESGTLDVGDGAQRHGGRAELHVGIGRGRVVGQDFISQLNRHLVHGGCGPGHLLPVGLRVEQGKSTTTRIEQQLLGLALQHDVQQYPALFKTHGPERSLAR